MLRSLNTHKYEKKEKEKRKTHATQGKAYIYIDANECWICYKPILYFKNKLKNWLGNLTSLHNVYCVTLIEEVRSHMNLHVL